MNRQARKTHVKAIGQHTPGSERIKNLPAALPFLHTAVVPSHIRCDCVILRYW